MVQSSRSALGDLTFAGTCRRARGAVRRAEKAAGQLSAMLLIGEVGTGRATLARRVHATAIRRGPFVALDAAGPLNARAGLSAHIDHAELWRARGGSLLIHNVTRLDRDFFYAIAYELQFSAQLIFAMTPGVAGGSRARRVLRQAVFDMQPMNPVCMPREPVVEIRLPPLRERSDLEELATAVLQETCRRRGLSNVAFSRGALSALHSHPWPQNIAELIEVVGQAVASLAGRSTIRATDLPKWVRAHAADELDTEAALGESSERDPDDVGPDSMDIPTRAELHLRVRVEESDRPLTMAQLEAAYLLRVLRDCNGNQGRAAKVLGLHRNTVARKLRELGHGDLQ
jgi:DNA-binding NtrC family response regulator